MRRLLYSLVGVLAVAAIVVGINMFADARLAQVQLDLTRGGLYTLSGGTRQVLSDLKEPVTLRLFYSRKLGAAVPQYGAFADHVREMLQAYAGIAHGKLKLEFFDPEPFSDTEDRAVAYGLQGLPLDQSGAGQVYFGLVGSNLEDDERTIPFFQADRERFLEYDLTKLIFDLSNPKRPVVGLMSSLPLDGDPQAMMMARGAPGGPGQPYASAQLLRQTNTVKSVPTDAQVIDPDIQVLVVASALNLSEQTLYAIDQFVMRGGRLLALVDPWSEALGGRPGPSGMPPADTHSDLKRLFDAWGIAFDPTEVVGDLTGAWRVRAGADRQEAANYVAWFNVRNGLNHNDPATADLQQVTVASAGFLAKKPDAAIEFTPLLTSSARSGLIPVDKVKMPEPAKLLAEFRPDGTPRVLAARVRGKLHSAFSAAPPPADGKPAPEKVPAYRAETDGPANMVLIADSDLLADRFWVRIADFFGQPAMTPFADNGPFVANLVGTLAGGDALIGLRARGDTNHPFQLVADMQATAEAQYRQTEQGLQKHLDDVEKQLRSLRQGSPDSAERGRTEAVITPEQREAIDAARKDIVDTRRQLRAVQLELNREISRLETSLRVFNIVLVPALLALAAVVLGLMQRRRRARARA